MQLKSKVILVTGAGSGIGRSVAKIYAANGATIILLDKSPTNLNSIYDEIIHAKYLQPVIYPCNLATATPEDYVALGKEIEKQFGSLDAILHNAAILGELGPIEHSDIAAWYEVLQVNLNSAFLLTKILLPLLRQTPQGKLIFTLDTDVIKPEAYWGAYAVSKAGVQALAQILSSELEQVSNITVHTITPGPVATPLRRAAYPAEDVSKLQDMEELMMQYLHLW